MPKRGSLGFRGIPFLLKLLAALLVAKRVVVF